VIHPTTAFVAPNTRLLSSGRQINVRGPAASCNSSDPLGVVTPTCLQELYGIPTTPATQSSNTLLVTGYVDQWAQSADLAVTNSKTWSQKPLIPLVAIPKTCTARYTTLHHVHTVDHR
jgi:hypothetical protein